ncbi:MULTISPECIES: hypothetical protein [Cellulomonas]|uniref:hypothetical protein n=1 Tax=Cellulomonas TaxID=1707 RepID=UPI0010A91F73|nr:MULTISPECIES: hypothetical protein [Cellulomonas]
MRRGQGAGAAALAVAVVLTAAGCSAGSGADGGTASARVPAAVPTRASCLVPEVLHALALDPAPSRATTSAEPSAPVERGGPPDDFVADTVLVCGRGEPLRDSAGTWHSVTSTRLEGDLTQVLRLLDERRTTGTCEEGPAPQVWLVDALDGAVLLPEDTACTGAGDALTAALAELDVVRTTEEPVELAVPTADGTPGAGGPGAPTPRP